MAPPGRLRVAVAPGRDQRRENLAPARGDIPTPAPPWNCANFHVFDPVYSYDPAFDWPEVPPEFDCDDDVFERSSWALKSFDLRAGLATLTMPVLMLWGEACCYASIADEHAAAFTSADVTTRIVAGAGHSLPFEGRDAAYTAIRTFLEPISR